MILYGLSCMYSKQLIDIGISTTITMAKIIATSLVKNMMKRALRSAFLAKVGTPGVSFDTRGIKTWVESPDIGRRRSLIASQIDESVAKEAMGEKFPGQGISMRGRERADRWSTAQVGGDVVLIPKEYKYEHDVCEIDGENVTYAQRSAKISAAVPGAKSDWNGFMDIVGKYSHPMNPGEWDGFVAKVYAWVMGGNRPSMIMGKWTPAPLRPDEIVAEEDKCEAFLFAEKQICEAHGRAEKYRTLKKSALFWNHAGAMWEQEKTQTPEAPDAVEPTVAIRPPTFKRAASRYYDCEENCSSDAASF